jgi:hypothetical protein
VLASGASCASRRSRRRAPRFLIAAAAIGAAILAVTAPRAQDQPVPIALSRPSELTAGIRYYTLDDARHLGPDAPISARAIEVRPDGTRLDLEIGKDGTQGRDTVQSMARRRGAVAAVNAGFFGASGDPAGVLKIDGLLISDYGTPRGAVAFARADGPPLLFDRVTARARVRAGRTDVPIGGVDRSRGRREVVLYTPRYGATTRTRGDGTEWTLEGQPLRVTHIGKAGDSRIPRAGYVLSASGAIPRALARLERGAAVSLAFTYAPALGTSAADWGNADDIVSGAGLLLWRGRAIEDWTPERLQSSFVTSRHPRTIVGRDREGDTWLVTIDGRQPGQ